MNEYEPEAKIRVYQVKCWQAPKDDKSRFGRHFTFGVVCTSATAAIALINAKHPDCRIDSVNEKAIVDYVLDTPDSATGDV